MEWEATSTRVALHVGSSSLLRANGVDDARACQVLAKLGIHPLRVNGLGLLRQCVGMSRYKRGAHPKQAPAIVDCSVLVKWWYAMHGIRLRRYAVDQRDQGVTVNENEEPCLGDLVFSAGRYGRFREDSHDGVGHVGICTGEGTVIHAASSRAHVIEVPYVAFTEAQKFRGRRRILPKEGWRVFRIPSHRCVEYTGDLVWLILQSL